MTSLTAPQPPKAKTLDNLAYDNLKKLCPDLAKLKEDQFLILKAKSKAAPDVTIGCKHPEKGEYSGVYEICSQHGEIKVSTTIEISHKDKTAVAMMFETDRAGEKKRTEGTVARFQDLLKDLTLKGYKQANTQNTDRPR